jgi:hypothetical protein
MPRQHGSPRTQGGEGRGRSACRRLGRRRPSQELDELVAQVGYLEQEVSVLRRKLADTLFRPDLS